MVLSLFPASIRSPVRGIPKCCDISLIRGIRAFSAASRAATKTPVDVIASMSRQTQSLTTYLRELRCVYGKESTHFHLPVLFDTNSMGLCWPVLVTIIMSSISLPTAPIHRRVTVLAIWVIAICMIILLYFMGRFGLYLVRVIAMLGWCWSDTEFGYLYFRRLLGLASGFVGIVAYKQRCQYAKTQLRDQEQGERIIRGTYRSAKRSSSRSSGSVIATEVTQSWGKHKRKEGA